MPADHFTVTSVVERLKRRRRDPWQDYWRARQRIGARAFDAIVGRSS
ncbi:MAG TPA: hypothetical protein VK886_00910 [Vicinamibacterales bacterium]|nr:hypothetical protein [Vicinamibacterales bacterium]